MGDFEEEEPFLELEKDFSLKEGALLRIFASMRPYPCPFYPFAMISFSRAFI